MGCVREKGNTIIKINKCIKMSLFKYLQAKKVSTVKERKLVNTIYIMSKVR